MSALVIALRERGFDAAARSLSEAEGTSDEVSALRYALATVDGASYVLRIHARALRNTSAAYERGRLRGLEADLLVRLGALLRRPVDGVAQNVQGLDS